MTEKRDSVKINDGVKKAEGCKKRRQVVAKGSVGLETGGRKGRCRQKKHKI
jgi:hypothetical protein